MKNLFFFTFLLSGFYLYSQEAYDNCSDALYLCAGVPQTANNYDATTNTCIGCEDDVLVLTNCLIPDNTIWFKFMTNDVGGIVTVDLNNIVYNTDTSARAQDLEVIIYEVGTPCIGTSYNNVVDCAGTINTAGANSFSISSNVALNPNTMYYILVDGGFGGGVGFFFPGEATFDISVSGPGVTRSTASMAITTPTTNICNGDLVTLTASKSNCVLDSLFYWSINGSPVATTSVDTFQTNAIQDGDYVSVYTICDTVCGVQSPIDSAQFSVLTLAIDAGMNVEIQEGNTTQLNGTGNGSGMVFSWTPTTSLSNPNVSNPVASPTQTTTYYMTVTDTVNGCTDSDSVTVTVKLNLKIPDTFTPNGDGFNDTWEILTIEEYPNAEVIIYNRTGQVVYKTIGYPESKWWNGNTNKGNPCSPGAYFYYIDLKDPAYPDPFRGAVNLIR